MLADTHMWADGMTQLKRVAKALTTGWLSELDVFNATGCTNGWGRESDLRLKLGMTVKRRKCPCENGGFYLRKHITKTEYNRVFGRKKKGVPDV